MDNYDELIDNIKSAIDELNNHLAKADEAGLLVFCDFSEDRSAMPGHGGPLRARHRRTYKPEWVRN